jgi:hypothetical protein
LALEATFINHNFSQQVLKTVTETLITYWEVVSFGQAFHFHLGVIELFDLPLPVMHYSVATLHVCSPTGRVLPALSRYASRREKMFLWEECCPPFTHIHSTQPVLFVTSGMDPVEQWYLTFLFAYPQM